jgi:heme exporter protein A
MIEMIDLSCARGERLLFSGLGLTLKPGELLTVLGENGSGKTSLLRMLCGLLPPDRGTILWEGKHIGLLRELYAAHLTYIGHLNGLKDDLTPSENLQVSAQLGGDASSEAGLRDALEAVGLPRHAQVLPTRALSQGQKRRVALARLWLSTRRLWILDEPFAALDEAGIGILTKRLRTHVGQGGIVVMATHQEVGLDAGIVRRLRLTG